MKRRSRPNRRSPARSTSSIAEARELGGLTAGTGAPAPAPARAADGTAAPQRPAARRPQRPAAPARSAARRHGRRHRQPRAGARGEGVARRNRCSSSRAPAQGPKMPLAIMQEAGEGSARARSALDDSMAMAPELRAVQFPVDRRRRARVEVRATPRRRAATSKGSPPRSRSARPVSRRHRPRAALTRRRALAASSRAELGAPKYRGSRSSRSEPDRPFAVDAHVGAALASDKLPHLRPATAGSATHARSALDVGQARCAPRFPGIVALLDSCTSRHSSSPGRFHESRYDSRLRAHRIRGGDRGTVHRRIAGARAGVKTAAPAKAPIAKAAAFDATPCLGCHAPVKALYDSGKHKGVGCNTCHDGTAAHLADSSKRPTTKTDLANCGGCHQNQYQTYAQMNWHRTARFEKKQMTGPAPDPAYDLLMSPHGFTQGAQPAARAHVRAARPVRRRPRVRRPVRHEGVLALSGGLRRFQGLGRRDRSVSRQHRPEGVQAGHGGGGEPRVPVLQDAGPHPRMGVHGRPRAQREMEPHVEGRRARQVGRTMRSTASSATTRTRRSRASSATR